LSAIGSSSSTEKTQIFSSPFRERTTATQPHHADPFAQHDTVLHACMDVMQCNVM
jgi:hypothetical protein